jgi:hypothetical protein
MGRKIISIPAQVSKSQINENSSGSDNVETLDEAKKEGGINREEKPKEEMKSIDEWVYDEPVR